MAQTYLIRKPDPDTWLRFKVAAASEGKTMRAIILRLISNYVEKVRKQRT
jgi:hypothetical protein